MNDFPLKKNQIYIFKTYYLNFGTERARNLKFVSKCQYFYCILLITQFRPKMDLGPFENELFKYNIISTKKGKEWSVSRYTCNECCLLVSTGKWRCIIISGSAELWIQGRLWMVSERFMPVHFHTQSFSYPCTFIPVRYKVICTMLVNSVWRVCVWVCVWLFMSSVRKELPWNLI